MKLSSRFDTYSVTHSKRRESSERCRPLSFWVTSSIEESSFSSRPKALDTTGYWTGESWLIDVKSRNNLGNEHHWMKILSSERVKFSAMEKRLVKVAGSGIPVRVLGIESSRDKVPRVESRSQLCQNTHLSWENIRVWSKLKNLSITHDRNSPHQVCSPQVRSNIAPTLARDTELPFTQNVVNRLWHVSKVISWVHCIRWPGMFEGASIPNMDTSTWTSQSETTLSLLYDACSIATSIFLSAVSLGNVWYPDMRLLIRWILLSKKFKRNCRPMHTL